MGLLTALLLGLLVAGCESGSDGSNFVATPGESGNNNAGTGSVTFNFIQAQSQITVPTGTTNLRFEFFTDLGGTGSLILRVERAFAASVTIDGVPNTARSVVVTAYDADGFPISEFTANVSVVAGARTTVSATDGSSVPVTLTGLAASPAQLSLSLTGAVQLDVDAKFSNGDSVRLSDTLLAEAVFNSADVNTAVVSANGTVSAVLAGETFVTVTFRGEVATVPVAVSTGTAIPPLAQSLTVDPTAVTLPAGTVSEPLVFTVTFEGPIVRTVGSAQGVTFSSTNPGITVNANDQIVVGNGVAGGTTATVTGTFGGLSAEVDVTVDAATLDSISITPGTASLPFGGFEQQFTVNGSFSNGTTVQIDPSNLSFSNGGSPLFSIDADGLLTTALNGASGTGTVTADHLFANVNAVTATVMVGDITINNLVVSPSPVALSPGDFVELVITAELSNGGTANVTDFASLDVTSTGSGFVLNGNRVVGVTPGAGTITVTIPGAGVGGADVSKTVNVTVAAIQLESVNYIYAGNTFTDNQLNLPRGYVGIFEIEGTFTNGAVRKLLPSEYNLVDLNTGINNPTAVQLFNTNFEITPIAGRYIDGRPAPGTITGEQSEEIDDFLGNVRYMDNDPMVLGSDENRVVVRSTYRAVAADWRRGPSQAQLFPEPIAGPNSAIGTGTDFNAPTATVNDQEPDFVNSQFVAANGTENFRLEVVNALEQTPGEFDRVFSVTVTDPDNGPSFDNGATRFANYPSDPNIAVGTPRELEIRVNFPIRSLNSGSQGEGDPFSYPPSVEPQSNFKLAEANIRFDADDLGAGGGVDLNLLHHRPTESGYIGITSNVPVDIAALDLFVTPLGGAGALPVLITPPTFAGGIPTNPMEYTPGVYGNSFDVFGPTAGVATQELAGFRAGRDPGPSLVNNTLSSPDGRAPSDILFLTFQRYTNNGLGFDITIPTLFSLDPPDPTVTIEVGQSQVFRTLVQFRENEAIVDRSLDYKPRLVGGTSAVGKPTLATGQLTVSGTNAVGLNGVVTALDVAGNPIAAVGTLPNLAGNTVAATAQVAIDVIPAP